MIEPPPTAGHGVAGQLQDIRFFNHTLDEMNITGTRKRLWLKQFKSDPQKTTQQFYNKLERMYSGWKVWEIAKVLLIRKYPNLAAVPEERNSVLKERCSAIPSVPHQRNELPPVPKISVTTEKFDLDYFLKINNGKWGDAHYDYDEYLAKL